MASEGMGLMLVSAHLRSHGAYSNVMPCFTRLTTVPTRTTGERSAPLGGGQEAAMCAYCGSNQRNHGSPYCRMECMEAAQWASPPPTVFAQGQPVLQPFANGQPPPPPPVTQKADAQGAQGPPGQAAAMCAFCGSNPRNHSSPYCHMECMDREVRFFVEAPMPSQATWAVKSRSMVGKVRSP